MMYIVIFFIVIFFIVIFCIVIFFIVIFFSAAFFIDPQYKGQIAPLTWETVRICILPAFIAAAAGAVEAVMTMEVVNDLTETVNEAPNQQLVALSIGSFFFSLFSLFFLSFFLILTKMYFFSSVDIFVFV